jgi:hypothetical protein
MHAVKIKNQKSKIKKQKTKKQKRWPITSFLAKGWLISVVGVVETTPKPLVVAPAKLWLTGHSFCFCLFFLVFNIFYFFNNYFL